MADNDTVTPKVALDILRVHGMSIAYTTLWKACKRLQFKTMLTPGGTMRIERASLMNYLRAQGRG